MNIASPGELNHRINRGKSKIIVLLHEFRETSVCRINNNETSMTLSATSEIWRIEILRGYHYGTDKDMIYGIGAHDDTKPRVVLFVSS